jgi:hypothetical protein
MATLPHRRLLVSVGESPKFLEEIYQWVIEGLKATCLQQRFAIAYWE